MKTKKKKRYKKMIRAFVDDYGIPIRKYNSGIVAVYASTVKNLYYKCPAKITVEWTEP